MIILHHQKQFVASLLALLLAGVFSTLILNHDQARAADSQELAEKVSQQEKQIELLRSQAAAYDQRVDGAEATLERNRSELAEATARLQTADDHYQTALKVFEDRLATLYKMGGGELLAVVLSTESFSEIFSRTSYLITISENDLRLMEQVKAEARELRSLRARVDSLKQASAGEVNMMKAQQQQLQAQLSGETGRLIAAQAELAQLQAQEREAEAQRQAAEAALARSSMDGIWSLLGSVAIGPPPEPAGLHPSGDILSGTASWYGPGFHGNNTASGEPYNMYSFTAAHKTLPFGTWLKVTYQGRSVFVKINDRGPYVGDRFLDLSLAAARHIGLSGIGQVTAELYR